MSHAGHIKAVALINIVSGILGVGLGVFLFFLFFVPGALSGEPQAAGALLVCAVVIGGTIAIISIPAIVAGFGLLRYRNWARGLTIVLAIVNMPLFPVGTAIGGYEFWVMVHPETRALMR